MYLNPDFYPEEQKYAVCPFGYFESPLKEFLISKLGYMGMVRDDGWPPCGVVIQQGDYPEHIEDYHLSMAEHNYDEKQLIVMGRESGISASDSSISDFSVEFTATDSGQVNRDISDVTDNSVYFYYKSSLDFSILVQLSSDKQSVRVEKSDVISCGSIPSEVSATHTFFRLQ